MKLRRLNEQGVERFAAFLDSLKTDAPQLYPESLLSDPEASEEIEPATEVELRTFGSRFAIAEYLHSLLANSSITDVDRARGLWAWLALLYFEQLCPKGKNGDRSPGERARYIPEFTYRRIYRHLLLGPYRVYRAHREDPKQALALLCGKPHELSDVYRDLAEDQELVRNPAVVGAATRLYFDQEKDRLKRIGHRSKPGSMRRLQQILKQFDVTWDLYSMNSEHLLAMLPEEFDRFKMTERAK